MAEGTSKPIGSQSDTPKPVVSSAPQRVDVVVENSSSAAPINIPAELAIFLLRVVVKMLK